MNYAEHIKDSLEVIMKAKNILLILLSLLLITACGGGTKIVKKKNVNLFKNKKMFIVQYNRLQGNWKNLYKEKNNFNKEYGKKLKGSNYILDIKRGSADDKVVNPVTHFVSPSGQFIAYWHRSVENGMKKVKYILYVIETRTKKFEEFYNYEMDEIYVNNSSRFTKLYPNLVWAPFDNIFAFAFFDEDGINNLYFGQIIFNPDTYSFEKASYKVTYNKDPDIEYCQFDWSVTGKYFAYVEYNKRSEESTIHILDIDDGLKKYSIGSAEKSAFCPKFSNNKKTEKMLAFVQYELGYEEIYKLKVYNDFSKAGSGYGIDYDIGNKYVFLNWGESHNRLAYLKTTPENKDKYSLCMSNYEEIISDKSFGKDKYEVIDDNIDLLLGIKEFLPKTTPLWYGDDNYVFYTSCSGKDKLVPSLKLANLQNYFKKDPDKDPDDEKRVKTIFSLRKLSSINLYQYQFIEDPDKQDSDKHNVLLSYSFWDEDKYVRGTGLITDEKYITPPSVKKVFLLAELTEISNDSIYTFKRRKIISKEEAKGRKPIEVSNGKYFYMSEKDAKTTLYKDKICYLEIAKKYARKRKIVLTRTEGTEYETQETKKD